MKDKNTYGDHAPRVKQQPTTNESKMSSTPVATPRPTISSQLLRKIVKPTNKTISVHKSPTATNSNGQSQKTTFVEDLEYLEKII